MEGIYISMSKKQKLGKRIFADPLCSHRKNLVVILIATGNNYLAVDFVQRVT